MAAFARCEQEASNIIAARMQDAGFRQWQERSSETRNLESSLFIQGVRIIVAIALFGADRSAEDQSPRRPQRQP